jgi:hypothetical protein
MAAGQVLRGLVGQSLNSRRRELVGSIFQYPPGSYTFVAPQSGRWKFVGWSPGGGNSGDSSFVASGSGAYIEVTRVLSRGQAVTIVVSAGVSGSSGSGNTSMTFPDGTIAVCTPGQRTGPGGVASGGDVNLNGSAAGSPGQGTGGGQSGGPFPGGGAPGNLPFLGGRAGAQNFPGNSPGGGAGASGSGNLIQGGDGLVLAYFQRL